MKKIRIIIVIISICYSSVSLASKSEACFMNIQLMATTYCIGFSQLDVVYASAPDSGQVLVFQLNGDTIADPTTISNLPSGSYVLTGTVSTVYCTASDTVFFDVIDLQSQISITYNSPLSVSFETDSVYTSLYWSIDGALSSLSPVFTHTFSPDSTYTICLQKYYEVCEWDTCFSMSFGSVHLDENAQMSFNIYPNPVNAVLTVEGHSPIGEVVVLNALGQKVYEKRELSQKTVLDVTSLKSGFYTIIIHGQSYKFIKN